ncbi:MAG: hypothetical protein LBJ95_04645 [Oscillospiraceae bacterium]|nr:hypothetical protein [Oscillospiraceae bacterium]
MELPHARRRLRCPRSKGWTTSQHGLPSALGVGRPRRLVGSKRPRPPLRVPSFGPGGLP